METVKYLFYSLCLLNLHSNNMKTQLILFAVFLLGLSGLSAQTPIPSKETNSLRVMCYNVRNCRGMDEVTDFQRIADVMNRVNADVIAVQELDSGAQRTQGIYLLQELASRTRMFPTYGPAIDFQGGKYGVGILSKEKPLNYRTIPLPGREEQRVLLIAEFDEYVFCCTHFSLTKEDQAASVPLINKALEGIQKPVFLAGDMNSVYDSPAQVAIREKFTTLSDYKANTIPTVNPNRCIDYIYGYNNGHSISVLRRAVLFDEQVASDHLPLYADIRIAAEADQIIKTKPFLQNPTDNGITVSWFTHVPVHGWVEYGTSRENLDQSKETLVDGQVICNNTHQKIRLTDLQPGVTYYYRTCSREITLYEAYKKEFGHTVHSDIYSFTMPSASSSDFTAIILNDLHKKTEVIDLLAKQIKDIRYDLVFFNGDCIDDPKNETEAVFFLSYMNERVKAEQVPVFYMRGNHEIRNAYSIQLRELFDYVGDKTYGAFSWGDTRFVMLDCGEDKPDSTWVYYGLNDFTSLRQDQLGFLKEELSGKAYKKATRHILIHHIPIFGMSEKSYIPSKELWSPALSKATFDICLNAHTHRFAYHPKGSDGNNFPVIIGGGNTPQSATVMILKKTGKELTLTVLNTQGEEIQKLTL